MEDAEEAGDREGGRRRGRRVERWIDRHIVESCGERLWHSPTLSATLRLLMKTCLSASLPAEVAHPRSEEVGVEEDSAAHQLVREGWGSRER